MTCNDCDRPAASRGLCAAHYLQWWRTGRTRPIQTRGRNVGPCLVDDCNKPAKSRGWCHTHYARWYQHGDAEHETSTLDRFLAKVSKRDGCWEWTGNRNKAGYGRFKVESVTHHAHRWSYEQFIGPIPATLEIDHLCFNPSCVNPDHLEAVTAQENRRRRRSVGTSLTKGDNTWAYK